MTSRTKTFAVALQAVVWLAAWALCTDAQTTYFQSKQKCGVPTVVSMQGVKPNVMIVMDYSGSMQFPAYQSDSSFSGYYASRVARFSSTIDSAYAPGTTYYGIFDSDTYYTYTTTTPGTQGYFTAAATQPAETLPRTISSSASGVAGQITFTTTEAHGLAVNDSVILRGLDENKALNGTGLQVIAVSGNNFTVAGTFGGTSDTMGTAQKRIFGNWTVGLSGNLLNWATASRIDAALKALIGGRSRTGADTGFIYLDAQGSRRTVRESTNANALFYVRPATYDDTDNYAAGTYLDKTIYMNITGRSRGYVRSSGTGADPANVTFGTTNRRMEWWVYTNTGSTNQTVTISSEDTSAYAYVGVAKAGVTPPAESSPWNYNDTTNYWLAYDYADRPSVTFSAVAGSTYYIAIGRNRSSGYGYAFTHNVLLNPAPQFDSADHAPCRVPPRSNVMVRLRIPEDQRGGVIKEAFDSTRIGFMFYNNSVATNTQGKIVRGCGDSNLETLRHSIEEIVPYYGTPTGEAMWEAYDYFKQANDHTANANNSAFISRGTLGIDPYYDLDKFNQVKFMPCRDSYVILVSDGDWNGAVDPIMPAREMHINDLRTLDSGDTAKQSVNVFSFFAFSPSAAGKNAMKAVAQYGAYTNDCGAPDDWPYPRTSYTPGGQNSLQSTWPIPECDPNGTYYPCCKEWTKKYDRDQDGTDDSKGVPDTYYDASDGAQLEAGLRAVFQSLIRKTGAAGSVATVAQKVSEFDVVVRAMFRAGDPVVKGRYIWRGHLESYYPYNATYDFEQTDSICMEMAVGERHCWDAGEVIAGDGEAARTIYYGKYDTTNGWTLPEFTTANVADLQPKLNAGKCDDTWTDQRAAEELIKWVRGVDPTASSGTECYRTRTDSMVWLPSTQSVSWPLGDLIYSTPLISGVPELAAVSLNDPDVAAYQTFRNTEVAKAQTPPVTNPQITDVYKKMVYVGGNDGMLHAVVLAVANGTDSDGDIVWIDARTDLTACYDSSGKMITPATTDACRLRSYVGKELWAYMPSNVLSSLKDLADQSYGATGGTCSHRFMIDLSPQVYQVYRTTGAHTGWRQVIVGGQRGGGDIYFAIDITDPDNPELLWEYSVLKNFRDYDSTLGIITNSKDTSSALYDYTTYYDQLKCLATTWSVPYVGRIRIPSGVTFGGVNCSETGGCKKHLMFAGGGFRVFDETVTATVDGHVIDLKPLMNPHIIGIDINTGENLLGDLWPTFRKEAYLTDRFPDLYRVFDRTNEKEYRVPYAMGDMLVLDEWDGGDPAIPRVAGLGNDGFIDRIYVGDLSGYFYGYKFNFDTTDTTKGVLIDVWSTRSISECVRDAFRWNRQPIATRPQASDDTNTNYLRVIVAAGKYDDAPGGDDDKQDAARASLYNLLDEKLTVASLDDGKAIGSGSGYKAKLNFRCGDHVTAYGDFRDCYTRTWSQCTLNCSACDTADRPDCCGAEPSNCSSCPRDENNPCQLPLKVASDTNSGRAKCCYYDCTIAAYQCDGCAKWVKDDKTADCGQATCCDKRDTAGCTNPPCWACIYDLVLPFDTTVGDMANYPGERFVSKPLIAWGTVFITSYVPAYDPCTAMGTGYLYIFDYSCTPFPEGWTPLRDAAFVPDEMRTPDNSLVGLRLSLGSGPPSDPVLDSGGNYVFVQMGTAEIIRIGVQLQRPQPSTPEEPPVGGGGGTSVTPLPDWFRIRGWREGQ